MNLSELKSSSRRCFPFFLSLSTLGLRRFDGGIDCSALVVAELHFGLLFIVKTVLAEAFVAPIQPP